MRTMAPISDSVSPEPRIEKSHTFPALHGRAARNSNDPQAIRDAFKPLFQSACGHSAPQRDPADLQADDTRDSEEHVRQAGIQRGIDAGREDACKLTRQQIAPLVKGFFIELDQMSECLVRIEENSCRQIFKMALSIAENILGGAPGRTVEGLAPLKAELQDRMAKLYQLELMLNPEDMHALSEFMACEEHQWQDRGYIKLHADAQLERGSLISNAGAQPDAVDDPLTRSLDDMLDKASTK